MRKLMSLAVVAAAAALPQAASAITDTLVLNQGYAGTTFAGGAFSTANQTASVSATITLNALPGGSVLNPALPNNIVLNGTFNSLSGFNPNFDFYYTFTNAQYDIKEGPSGGNSYNIFQPCPGSGACVQTVWTTNPVTGTDSNVGLNIDFATNTVGGWVGAGYQNTSALQLASGTVACVTGLGGACSAGRTGTEWDLFSIDISLNALAGFSVLPALTKLELGMISDSGGTAVGITNSPIPVPAAVWLFGSALGLLGVARRRRATA